MENVHVGIKIELLENHCGGFAHKFGFVFMGQKLAVDINFAGGRFLKEVHTTDRC